MVLGILARVCFLFFDFGDRSTHGFLGNYLHGLITDYVHVAISQNTTVQALILYVLHSALLSICELIKQNPIGSIDKSDLKRFIAWAETVYDIPCLHEFLTAIPTAELEPITEVCIMVRRH